MDSRHRKHEPGGGLTSAQQGIVRHCVFKGSHRLVSLHRERPSSRDLVQLLVASAVTGLPAQVILGTRSTKGPTGISNPVAARGVGGLVCERRLVRDGGRCRRHPDWLEWRVYRGNLAACCAWGGRGLQTLCLPLVGTTPAPCSSVRRSVLSLPAGCFQRWGGSDCRVRGLRFVPKPSSHHFHTYVP